MPLLYRGKEKIHRETVSYLLIEMVQVPQVLWISRCWCYVLGWSYAWTTFPQSWLCFSFFYSSTVPEVSWYEPLYNSHKTQTTNETTTSLMFYRHHNLAYAKNIAKSLTQFIVNDIYWVFLKQKAIMSSLKLRYFSKYSVYRENQVKHVAYRDRFTNNFILLVKDRYYYNFILILNTVSNVPINSNLWYYWAILRNKLKSEAILMYITSVNAYSLMDSVDSVQAQSGLIQIFSL